MLPFLETKRSCWTLTHVRPVLKAKMTLYKSGILACPRRQFPTGFRAVPGKMACHNFWLCEVRMLDTQWIRAKIEFMPNKKHPCLIIHSGHPLHSSAHCICINYINKVFRPSHRLADHPAELVLLKARFSACGVRLAYWCRKMRRPFKNWIGWCILSLLHGS